MAQQVGMNGEKRDGGSGLVMRAMEMVGSSPMLAAYLNTSSQQVIRWMLGHDFLPEHISTRLVSLLVLSPEALARELHMTTEEFEGATRRRERTRTHS